MDNAVVARAAEIKVLFTYASRRGEMMARGVGQLLTLWLKIREACNNAGQVHGFLCRTFVRQREFANRGWFAHHYWFV